jgi:hypothetical protein
VLAALLDQAAAPVAPVVNLTTGEVMGDDGDMAEPRRATDTPAELPTGAPVEEPRP